MNSTNNGSLQKNPPANLSGSGRIFINFNQLKKLSNGSGLACKDPPLLHRYNQLALL